MLQAGMHDTAYSLTDVRVLFELAHAGEVETGGLRALLGLDAGYLSRILARLEGDGLLARRRSDGDARKQVVTLTETGAALFDRLDRLSTEEIGALLAGLPEDGQDRLVTAMRTIRVLLGPGERREPYVLRPPRTGDLGWVVARHADLYGREYGWGMAFEKTVAGICAAFDPGAGDTGWIAEIGGERVGCVFCVRRDDETAQLRMLLVEPSARGFGLGRRLVEEVLRHAAAQGYKRIMLWTRDSLTAARRIYQTAGFALESQEHGEENGVAITEQIWARDL
ncbi:helix-turn-helix domain-containing GNAT family N-acetyltransferase [Nonomuraea sp. NBC_01738]|uniref:bifunctional helix-turn-helix transcriptional regulator/GNAT family N-acetyltransferase n=1 Tax=Nonomuraea sp. NBC_01738 TaxID=2976003 RepID=UPI002E166CDF|nr:helix-turn-helix domain-containing GNAT family N-acetyltransferase [Nonomuraea sp. NBC_01738]